MPRTKKPTKSPKPAATLQAPVPDPTVLNGPTGDVLTLSETAAYLRLPEHDVLRMVREQNLQARQVGAEWRFLKSAIQDWLRGGPPLMSNKEA